MKDRFRGALVKALVLLIVLVPVGAFLHYNLPGYDVVRIVGTEIRRVDTGEATSGQPQITRDVYVIQAVDPDDNDVRVYYNEDTGWGFPWFFKFDSANVQARAQELAEDRATALVTHYGWRVPMFSWFPNAVSVERVEPGYTPIPWFNIVFLLILAGLVAWVWISIARWRRRRTASL
ncbi:DUF1523 family protein [Salinarimonas ramus]|uniref:DUF1523 family protein n=1 Tax=Salinarimonas ramus TaxID=690164 RepID=A0A917Q410_9HYPH|nr:DUF1523 family protein [Salinarimonas ramus]GGK19923.1 hypothetical protein GCM10011322_03250 [Salinarimonas ramus]